MTLANGSPCAHLRHSEDGEVKAEMTGRAWCLEHRSCSESVSHRRSQPPCHSPWFCKPASHLGGSSSRVFAKGGLAHHRPEMSSLASCSLWASSCCLSSERLSGGMATCSLMCLLLCLSPWRRHPGRRRCLFQAGSSELRRGPAPSGSVSLPWRVWQSLCCWSGGGPGPQGRAGRKTGSMWAAGEHGLGSVQAGGEWLCLPEADSPRVPKCPAASAIWSGHGPLPCQSDLPAVSEGHFGRRHQIESDDEYSEVKRTGEMTL